MNPNPDLYVGVVIDGPQIDGTTQELFDYLSAHSHEAATLTVAGMSFTVKVNRISQKGF